MTREEFVGKWFPRMTGFHVSTFTELVELDDQFMADLDALISAEREQARKEALADQDAISGYLRSTGQ